MNNVSAEDLADMYQYGDPKCDEFQYGRYYKDKWIDDCIFWEYDWEMMAEEDRYCVDRNYITNLRRDLAKICMCPDHRHVPDDYKYKTPHLKY
jgi:hypothetical protein